MESRLELLESEMKILKSENSYHKEELVILKKKVTKLNNKLSEMEARSFLNNSVNRETKYGNIACTTLNKDVKIIYLYLKVKVDIFFIILILLSNIIRMKLVISYISYN